MSLACHLCAKVLTTPFNLKRHLRICHYISNAPTVNNQSGWSGLKQSGGGACRMNVDDDDYEHNSEASDSEREPDIFDDDDGDDSEQDTDDEEDTDTDSDEEENTANNSVFNRILRSIDKHDKLEKCQKQFRQKYAGFLEWLRDLKHNKIHRKIMMTARKLERDENYDGREALHAAVENRKFLLDDLVANYIEDEEEEEEEEEDAEEEEAEEEEEEL